MALDPRIPLEAGRAPEIRFDPSTYMQRGVQLRDVMTRSGFLPEQLRTNIAATQATTAQTQLQTETDARLLAGRRRMTDIIQRNTRADKNGRLKIDYISAVKQAAEMGVPQEIVAEYKDKILGQEATGIKNARDFTDYIDNQKLFIANLLRNEPDEATARLKLNTFIEQTRLEAQRRGFDPEEITARFAATFGEGKPVVQTSRQITEAMSISPQTERTNIAAGVGGSQIDPNSARSIKFQETLIANGADPKLVQGRSEQELRNDPTLATYLPDPGAMRTAQQTAAEIKARRDGLQASIDSYPQLVRDLKLDTRPGAIAASLWNRYVRQSPAAAALQAQIDAYNQDTGQTISIEQGLDAVMAVLKKHNEKLKTEQGVAARTAGGATPRQQAPGLMPDNTERIKILEQEFLRDLATGGRDAAQLIRELQGAGVGIQRIEELRKQHREKSLGKPTAKETPVGERRTLSSGRVIEKVKAGPDSDVSTWRAVR